MCGLAGYHTKNKLEAPQRKQRANILKGLMCAMQRRGSDSTGVAFIGLHEWYLHKDALAATKFVNEYETDMPGYCAIGHTRFATVGGVTPKNAHPFQRGHIVGAHNGSVTNWRMIDSAATVDSEVIFSELAATEDFTTVFPKLRGQFAIAWADLATRMTYLTRKDNPLYYANVKELNTIFWCSDEFDLRAVIAAQIGQSPKVKEVPENVVLAISRKQRITRHKVEFAPAWEVLYPLYPPAKKTDVTPFPAYSRDATLGYTDSKGKFNLWKKEVSVKSVEERIQDAIDLDIATKTIEEKWGYRKTICYSDIEFCHSCNGRIPRHDTLWFDHDWNSFCGDCFARLTSEVARAEVLGTC